MQAELTPLDGQEAIGITFTDEPVTAFGGLAFLRNTGISWCRVVARMRAGPVRAGAKERSGAWRRAPSHDVGVLHPRTNLTRSRRSGGRPADAGPEGLVVPRSQSPGFTSRKMGARRRNPAPVIRPSPMVALALG